MVTILSKQKRIALGHDNIDQLLPFHRLGDCLFGTYKRWIDVEWHSSEGRELGGNGRYVRYGNPWESLTFPVLTWEERDWIYDATDGEDGLVTYETFDNDEREWKIFNGVLSIVEETNIGSEWRNVKIEIRDLVDITP